MSSDPRSGQRLHDDAAKRCGLPASQQHHAQGEFPPRLWSKTQPSIMMLPPRFGSSITDVNQDDGEMKT